MKKEILLVPDEVEGEMVKRWIESVNRRVHYHCTLIKNLEMVKEDVLERDYDGFLTIDGQEGSGKTTLGAQVALFLDHSFCIDRIVFTPNQFLEAVEKASRGQAIMFDECMGYLGSRGSMSKFNRILIKVFSEMRSKNLFIILNIPSFFELDKYAAIHRSVALIHVHRRGAFLVYNYRKKKLLYINGKKYYSYQNPDADFIGNFTSYFPFDKEAYNLKKQESIKQYDKETNREKQLINQRNVLINYLYNEKVLNADEIAIKLGLNRAQVFKIVASSRGLITQSKSNSLPEKDETNPNDEEIVDETDETDDIVL